MINLMTAKFKKKNIFKGQCKADVQATFWPLCWEIIFLRKTAECVVSP